MIGALKETIEKEATPLVRYGGVLIFFVLASILSLDFHAFNDDHQNVLVGKQTELVALRQVEATDIWTDRYAQSKDLKELVEGRLWTGQTSGIISANVQQSLQKILKNVGAEQILITVDPNVDEINGITVLNFGVTCNLPSGSDLINILLENAIHSKSIIIAELRMTNNLRSSGPSRLNINGFIPIGIQLSAENGK